ncbi:hypothetical protein ACIA5H_28475 [Nocardia sp. NPDC051900]|uniref:hypothetical protein n=1 Tax=Nocardia sp. NPDC051900 TaxID=3364326 RepID=UPI003787B9CF
MRVVPGIAFSISTGGDIVCGRGIGTAEDGVSGYSSLPIGGDRRLRRIGRASGVDRLQGDHPADRALISGSKRMPVTQRVNTMARNSFDRRGLALPTHHQTWES